MTADPVQLARALVELPSPTGNEHAVSEFVARALADDGWHVERQPVSARRFNVYAHRGSPVVVLSTHLDTVPPPLPVREDAETLYGRGSCDAKGIAAAMIAAADELRAAGESRVALLFVVGEEDGSDGARAASSLTPKGRFLINGEPTENRLVTAQKGTLKVQLTATGRAAHSGYPHLGRSAITLLLDALQHIRELSLPSDPELGDCTINIGQIHGGVAANVIAPSAEAELLVRLVGPDAAIRTAIEGAAGSDVDVRFVPGIPPARGTVRAGWPSTVAAFASDLAFHGAWGTCYQLGPGSIHVAHTADEHIRKDDLREGVRLYVRLCRELLEDTPA